MDSDMKKKLDERLVNGEITIEEYENILNKIESDLDDSIESDAGCPLQIIGFSSHNNIFTAGNNSVWFNHRICPILLPWSLKRAVGGRIVDIQALKSARKRSKSTVFLDRRGENPVTYEYPVAYENLRRRENGH